MLVRRNSAPNLASCLFILQEKLSRSWLLVSTRRRGSPEVAPSCEKKPDAPVGVGETRMIGIPDEWQVPNVIGTLQSPIVLGSKLWSWGKNPSAKRFHPYRSSLTIVGETTLEYETDTTCTLVGVTVSKPGRCPPVAFNASGNCWVLSPKK